MKNQIVEKIEILWRSYWQQQSSRMFNCATDLFMEYVLNIPYCKYVLDKLKSDYPFKPEEIIRYNSVEYSELLKENSYIQVLSFLCYWYEDRKNTNKMKLYFNDCRWLSYCREATEMDKMQMFKTDIIRPIIDYIICNLNDEGLVLYLLDRYKQRTERFKTINLEGKGELDLQKDLFLYLFDEGLELGNSVNIGNGEVDFIIDVYGRPFVIEAKLYRKNVSCKKYMSQLKDYMGKVAARWGCLYIFTTEDVNFEFENTQDNIFVKTVYVGDKKPSNRDTQTKILS